jgi:nucleoside-diphosphate-sugar epimerase
MPTLRASSKRLPPPFPRRKPPIPKTRRILVTGATGFVGKHLIAFLEAEGKRTKRGLRLEITGTCFPEKPEHCRDFCAAVPGVKLISLDLRDPEAVEAAVAALKPDRIFHLAAISHVLVSWEKRRETIETNLIGTFNLFEAARKKAPSARILFVSSSDVYGRQSPRRMPLREDSRPNAVSPYAFTKLSGETLAEFYAQTEKLAIVIARPFTHTGPGQSADFVCSDWARQIAMIESGEGLNGTIKVGNIAIRRDYSDVRDIVRAYARLIEKGKSGEIYNVCSGKSPALRDILRTLIRLSKVEIKIEVDPTRFRKADIPRLAGSPAKIGRQLGWRPRLSLKTTLSDLLEEWREKIKSGTESFEVPVRSTEIGRLSEPRSGQVLITGGAGYIGSLLTGELLRAGRRVTVIDSLVHGGNSLLSYLPHPAFVFHRVDVRDRHSIRPFFKGVDAVVHLASIVGYPACAKAGRKPSFDCNVEGTRIVFEEAEAAGAERFLFASTYSNYGLAPDGRPVTEDSPLFPQSIYAETKIAAERYLLERAAASPLAPVLFRFATIFGPSPRTRFDLIINQFVWEAVVEKKLSIYQPRFNRSFVHVADVVRAIGVALDVPAEVVRGQIFNVGSNRANFTKDEIAGLIRKYAPPFDLTYPDLSFDGDMRDLRVAFDKIERILGWTAQISVEDGIRELVEAVSSGFLKR